MKKILIYGAGIAGKLVASEILKDPKEQYKIIGYIDDFQKIGKKIGKYIILGNRKNLQKLVKKYQIEEILIALPSAERGVIRNIIKACEDNKVNFKIVPQLIEILQKSKINLEQIRSVQPIDLLGREMITTDLKILEHFFNDSTVLITGAAGSIGSELCRQIAHFNTKLIIFLDWWENGMYDLENEFKKAFPQRDIVSIIGNIQDTAKVDYIFKKYKPDFVFHAAAFKHVPLMEHNPEEAVKNNIFGTKTVAEAALKFEARKFILISTDKAVNPTNIMGATKRTAELVIQLLNKKNKTKFSAVRFGNVLASSGSVIPVFKRQIAEGGPITVTHKRIFRYFMTIPEAVQLVLLSSFYGKGGEIFVLDMGEPVKIIDLARSLIRLSGLIPGKDIAIKVVGLRPGEKLYEEKLTDKENMGCVKEDKIYIAQNNSSTAYLSKYINALKKQMLMHNQLGLIKILKKLVPNFYHRRDNV